MMYLEGFWLSVVGAGCGLIALIIRYIFKSKCDFCRCCGIEIHRTVQLESEVSDRNLTNVNEIEVSCKV